MLQAKSSTLKILLKLKMSSYILENMKLFCYLLLSKKKNVTYWKENFVQNIAVSNLQLNV